MIIVRKSQDRGHFDYGWLNTKHTFSFNTYYDPKHVSFRSLRVINEDVVLPNEGFGTHPHKDMEIITYIISGELTHKDSTGTISTIKQGDIQVMTAGTGVTHSEYNNSQNIVHLLQIWITPSKKNLTPKYNEKKISNISKKNKLCLIASNDEKNNSLLINQNTLVFCSSLEKNKVILYSPLENRGIWIQVISGELNVNNIILTSGDGASIEREKLVEINAKTNSEFLLFDLE